jgi:hypothetical protein
MKHTRTPPHTPPCTPPHTRPRTQRRGTQTNKLRQTLPRPIPPPKEEHTKRHARTHTHTVTHAPAQKHKHTHTRAAHGIQRAKVRPYRTRLRPWRRPSPSPKMRLRMLGPRVRSGTAAALPPGTHTATIASCHRARGTWKQGQPGVGSRLLAKATHHSTNTNEGAPTVGNTLQCHLANIHETYSKMSRYEARNSAGGSHKMSGGEPKTERRSRSSSTTHAACGVWPHQGTLVRPFLAGLGECRSQGTLGQRRGLPQRTPCGTPTTGKLQQKPSTKRCLPSV